MTGRSRRYVAAASALALVLALGGCTGDDDKAAPTPDETSIVAPGHHRAAACR